MELDEQAQQMTGSYELPQEGISIVRDLTNRLREMNK